MVKTRKPDDDIASGDTPPEFDSVNITNPLAVPSDMLPDILPLAEPEIPTDTNGNNNHQYRFDYFVIGGGSGGNRE